MADVYYAKDRDGWRFDFQYLKQRCVSRGSYPTEKEAKDAADAKRREVRAIADGRELDQADSPFLSDFAEIYYDWAVKKGRVKANGSVECQIEMSLRFFGRRSDKPETINRFEQRRFKDKRPYHNLRMADVLRDGSWITKFDAWMDDRGIAGGTKNKYRSAMSQIYRHAMSPEWRNKTGVTRNPFAEIYRDAPVRRYTTFVNGETLVKVIDQAAPHLKLAIAIALYCPKFRHGSIVRLDRSRQKDSTAWVDEKIEHLFDTQHKTFHKTGLPLIAVVPPQLQALIRRAITDQDTRHARLLKRYKRDGDTRRLKRLGAIVCPRLIQWEGQPVGQLKKGMKSACERAGVPYGLKAGVTFHSLKHDSGTEAARLLGISDAKLQQLLGHSTNSANQVYRHLVATDEQPTSYALGKAVEAKLREGAGAGRPIFGRVG